MILTTLMRDLKFSEGLILIKMALAQIFMLAFLSRAILHVSAISEKDDSDKFGQVVHFWTCTFR